MKLADVALPVPLPQAFTYAVPRALEDEARAGARVIASFGARRLVGVILRVYEGEAPGARGKVKPLSHVLPGGALPEDLLVFLIELARYYFAPIGEVMKLALPPVERDTIRALSEPLLFSEPVRGVGARKVAWVTAMPLETGRALPKLTPKQEAVLARVRAVKTATVAAIEETIPGARAVATRLVALGLVAVETRDAPADPLFGEGVARDTPPELTHEQARALDAIAGAITTGTPATFVLHGVTGSGKTEVYLRAIEAANTRKKKARFCSSRKSRSHRNWCLAFARASATTWA